MGTTPMPSPDNKRAKGLRSPRQKKRHHTPDEEVIPIALSRLADAASTEQVRMSQLSDIEPVTDADYTSHAHAHAHHALHQQSAQQGGAGTDYSSLSQCGGLTQDLVQQPDLPSQPDIPAPELPSPALVFTSAGASVPQQSPSLVMGGQQLPYGGQHGHQQLLAGGIMLPGGSHGPGSDGGESGGGGRGGSKATRRGPMDEMRQLVRILVKIIPHSVGFLASAEEGGGGNRISEERIKYFLDCTLGDAPRPSWGVPNGWGSYLAELLTWVLQTPISKTAAMKCAKREPGRSWEAIDSELKKLGANTSTWPLPLSREGLAQAAKEPVLQAMPSNANKRGADEAKTPATKRRSTGAAAAASVESEAMGELDLWRSILRMLQAARLKMGSIQPGDPALAAVHQMRGQAQALLAEMCAIAAVGPPGGGAFGVLVQGPNGELMQYPTPGMHLQGPSAGHQQQQQQQQQQAPSTSPQQPPAPQPSVSQLSGLGPSQLLLPSQGASQGPAASAFLHLGKPPPPQAPAASHDAATQAAEISRAHEVTKPQALRPLPGASDAMQVDSTPAMHPPLDMSLPSTQDSERNLYERLEPPQVPEPATDADLQWPRGSQNGGGPEQHQQQEAQAAAQAGAGGLGGQAPAQQAPQQQQQHHAGFAGGYGGAPASASPAMPFRKSADNTKSSGLMPVPGVLPGPVMPGASGGYAAVQLGMLDQETIAGMLAAGLIAATPGGSYIAMTAPALQAMPQMVVPASGGPQPHLLQQQLQQQQQAGGQAVSPAAAQQGGAAPDAADGGAAAAAPAASAPSAWVPSLSADLR